MQIQITKDENERLRWMQKAAVKGNERPALQCVHISGNTMATADGFRVHAGKAPTGLLDETVAKLPDRILKRDEVIEVETPDHKSPTFSTLIPTANPAYEVRVEAKYLRDALEGFEGTVTLCFHKEWDPIELLGKAPDTTEAYVLLMPRRANPTEDSAWRPYQ